MMHCATRIFRKVRFARNLATLILCLTILFLTILDVARRTAHNQFQTTGNVKVIVQQSQSLKLEECSEKTVVLSSQLDTRYPWRSDGKCANYSISHMIPHCRKPIALASFPGSGNTWLRHMIEGAGGIFTGSRYKDLQIQMYGLWGEVRGWNDGTTIVQKTHDASKHHVLKDFDGRAILIIRNPYDAIISCHNFMYGGHHGRAPTENYRKSEWSQFVTTQVSKWIDMASNWTIHSTPEKVLVVHYEDLKSNLKSSMESILPFVGLPDLDQSRHDCLMAHKAGMFKRKHKSLDRNEVLEAFPQEMRLKLDNIIDHINLNILKRRGYRQMPLHAYKFYKQSEVTQQLLSMRTWHAKYTASRSDGEILKDLGTIQGEAATSETNSRNAEGSSDDFEEDKAHGAKLVLDQTFKWMSHNSDSTNNELFKVLGSKSESISKNAQGIVSKALELWPKFKKPFSKDPLLEVLEQEGFRGTDLKDLHLPT